MGGSRRGIERARCRRSGAADGRARCRSCGCGAGAGSRYLRRAGYRRCRPGRQLLRAGAVDLAQRLPLGGRGRPHRYLHSLPAGPCAPAAARRFAAGHQRATGRVAAANAGACLRGQGRREHADPVRGRGMGAGGRAVNDLSPWPIEATHGMEKAMGGDSAQVGLFARAAAPVARAGRRGRRRALPGQRRRGLCHRHHPRRRRRRHAGRRPRVGGGSGFQNPCNYQLSTR